MIHELKILPQYYCRVADGSKTFEVRLNDRGFQPGDTVVLREFAPETANPKLEFKIGYVFPLQEGFVVFSLLPKGDES